MLYPPEKSKLPNKILFDLLENKLPPDVLYHIYTYCDFNEKREIRQHSQIKHEIVIIITVIITYLIMYFIGYLFTKRFLGIFLILNFLLGYLIITASFLLLFLICLLFKACHEVIHK
tara:strand:+ start:108 stop:458 length:351 start_codon:yes stop_codon:yes gene_type:complete